MCEYLLCLFYWNKKNQHFCDRQLFYSFIWDTFVVLLMKELSSCRFLLLCIWKLNLILWCCVEAFHNCVWLIMWLYLVIKWTEECFFCVIECLNLCTSVSVWNSNFEYKQLMFCLLIWILEKIIIPCTINNICLEFFE